jgi:hypothetical protein
MNDTVEILLLVGVTVALTLWLSGRSNHGLGRRGHNTTLAAGAYGAPAAGQSGGATNTGSRRNPLSRLDAPSTAS